MSKKILSVKPTKNPGKFIFETEMPADELKKYVHEWFNDHACNVCIDSIKPSGLWANKLFVNVSFDQHELPGHALAELRRLMDDFNMNLEVEAKKTAQEAADWVVEYMGSINTTMHVNELTARFFARAFKHNRPAHYDGARIEAKDIKLIKNAITGTQLWPRETERLWHVKTKDKTYDVPEKVASAYLKHLRLFEQHGIGFGVQDWELVDLIDRSNLCNVSYDSVISITDPDGKVVWQKKTYCEVVVAHRSRNLFVTHEDADEIIGWMKIYHEHMCAHEPCAGCCTIHDQKGDVRISVLLVDIRHIYDENGHDMLADVLKAKPFEYKYCKLHIKGENCRHLVTYDAAHQLVDWMKSPTSKTTSIDTVAIEKGIPIHKSITVNLNSIEHLYDDNAGRDMLDGLAKAQKQPDVWHVEVRRQSIVGDPKFDLLPRMGLNLLDQLQSGKEMVSFHDVNNKAFRFLASSILRLWNNEKTLWSNEDKKSSTTSFSAPSLLSRIYE